MDVDCQGGRLPPPDSNDACGDDKDAEAKVDLNVQDAGVINDANQDRKFLDAVKEKSVGTAGGNDGPRDVNSTGVPEEKRETGCGGNAGPDVTSNGFLAGFNSSFLDDDLEEDGLEQELDGDLNGSLGDAREQDHSVANGAEQCPPFSRHLKRSRSVSDGAKPGEGDQETECLVDVDGMEIDELNHSVAPGVGGRRGRGRKSVRVTRSTRASARRGRGRAQKRSKEEMEGLKVRDDVRKVLDRMISKVETNYDAMNKKQQRREQREKKNQEKLEAKKQREEERAARKALKSGSVGKKMDVDPPCPVPASSGLLPEKNTPVLVDAWAFLNRFTGCFGLSLSPSLLQIERGIARPSEFSGEASVVIQAQVSLVNVLLKESYTAAVDTLVATGEAVKRDYLPGCPTVTRSTWQEGFRRYLLASNLAGHLSRYSCNSLSSGFVNQTANLPGHLAALPPAVWLLYLCGGVNDSVLACSPMLLLPGANAKAMKCLLNRNDAEGIGGAVSWFNEDGLELDAKSKTEFRRCLRELVHSKDSRSGAPGELLSDHGPASASCLREPVPFDLHKIGALVDNGAYAGKDGWKLFSRDVQSSCDMMRRAAKRCAPGLAREQRSSGHRAANGVETALERIETKGLKESDYAERDEQLARPFMPFEGCCVCWKDEDRTRILLCDQCDDEYHLYCLNPPLEEIPEGDWYCPVCERIRTQGNAASSQPFKGELAAKHVDGLTGCLGDMDYVSMEPQQRLGILAKICECMYDTNALRLHLDESVEKRKVLRKKIACLRAEIRQDKEKEKPAGGQEGSEGADVEQAPVTEEKKVLSSQEEAEIQQQLRDLRHEMEFYRVRPELLGSDRHCSRFCVLCGPTTGKEFPVSVFLQPDESQSVPKKYWGMYCKKSQIKDVMRYLDMANPTEVPLKDSLKQFGKWADLGEISRDCDLESREGQLVDSAQSIRRDIIEIVENFPEHVFDPVKGSVERRNQWRARILEASTAQELMAAIVCLSTFIQSDSFRPHWRVWGFPAQNPDRVNTFSGVLYHLNALKSGTKAIKLASTLFETEEGVSGKVRRSGRTAQLKVDRLDQELEDDIKSDGSESGGEQPARKRRRSGRVASLRNQKQKMEAQMAKEVAANGVGAGRPRTRQQHQSLAQNQDVGEKSESHGGHTSMSDCEGERDSVDRPRTRGSEKRRWGADPSDEELALQLHWQLNGRSTRPRLQL